MEIPVIGQLKQAKEEREALRFAMRIAKDSIQKAALKREYRRARNKVDIIREAMRRR